MKLSIKQLEEILQKDDEVEIEILPNGEVRQKDSGEKVDPLKVLTFRDNLGGEYAR